MNDEISGQIQPRSGSTKRTRVGADFVASDAPTIRKLRLSGMCAMVPLSVFACSRAPFHEVDLNRASSSPIASGDTPD
jgi:hypothetical protein